MLSIHRMTMERRKPHLPIHFILQEQVDMTSNTSRVTPSSEKEQKTNTTMGSHKFKASLLLLHCQKTNATSLLLLPMQVCQIKCCITISKNVDATQQEDGNYMCNEVLFDSPILIPSATSLS